MQKLTALSILLLAQQLTAQVSVHLEGNDLRVEINGQLFTEFRNDRHVPCLYPIMSAEGTHLTRQFPFVEGVAGEESDHPHHTGLWFTHGQVNGHDFWHGKKGEEILTRKIESIGTEETDELSQVSFRADLDWMVGPQKILTEERQYTISEIDSERIIDVSCKLRASESDIVFGDTKEGSFALRVAPTMRLNGEVAQGGITNSEGIQNNKAWGKRANWVAFHGPDSKGIPRVVTIFDHPDNLRHPTWWHARGYGLLTANPFGAKSYQDKAFPDGGDFTLEKGETLTLKYRVLLQKGELSAENLNEQWTAYSGLR